MKAFCTAVVVFGFAALTTPCCSAQQIKTIEACRSYREAWYTTADADTKRLSTRELVRRAEQMLTCGKEIDSKPFTGDMTAEEAMKAAIAHMGYPILASTYQQEALSRAIWFIDNKHLTKEFIADEEQGKIVKPRPIP